MIPEAAQEPPAAGGPTAALASGKVTRLGRIARASAVAAAAVVIGVLNTLALLGVAGLDPTNLAWLQSDPATYHLAWSFYRAVPMWPWPLTWSNGLGYPLGVSVSWLDPVPLMAILLRPLSPRLPAGFQYLGIYACVTFILQAYFSLKLAIRLFPRNALFILLTTLLLVGSPIITRRVGGHHALASHWLLLASLLCYLRDTRRPVYRWVLPFGVILFVAGGINPYLAALCVLFAGAGVLRLLLERRAGWATAITLCLALAATIASSFVLFGLIVPGRDSGYATSGYELFSMNLLSPINPMRPGSPILPRLPVATSGQYEGYNYLGAGILALLAGNAVIRPRGWRGLLRPTPTTLPLVCLGAICTIAALSSTITLGPWTILHVDLPAPLARFVSGIRAPGRLFWPAHYLIVLLAVALTYRNWRPPVRELLLAAAFALQLVDLSGLRSQVRAGYDRQVQAPLHSPAWRNLRTDYERLLVLPAWQCAGTGSPGGAPGFQIFGQLAADQGLSTNSYYAARYSAEQRRTHCYDMLASALKGSDLDPRAAYVVDDKIALAWAVLGVNSHVCDAVDGFQLCTRRRDTSPPRADLQGALQDRVAVYELGRRLSFGHGGKARRFAWLGWSPPEAPNPVEGIWSDGLDASLMMRLQPQPSTPVLLEAKVRAFVTERHPVLDVFVVANGQSVGRWTFTSWGQPRQPWEASELRHLEIPAAVIARSPVLFVQFAMLDPRSPESLGVSPDGRLLGMHLRELRISAESGG